MGLGSFGLGTSPLGADPVYRPVKPTPPLLPRAVKYDPVIRQFVLLDQYGNATDVHPVDQIVALRLTSYEGQSMSETDLGTRLRTISSGLAPKRAQQLATAEVKRVLQDLLDAGDVKLVSVIADVSVYSRAMFAVTYVNLRDPRNATRYPTTIALNAGVTNGG